MTKTIILVGLLIVFAILAYINERRGMRKGLMRARELAHKEANEARKLQEVSKREGFKDVAARSDAVACSMRCFANLMDSELASRHLTELEGE